MTDHAPILVIGAGPGGLAAAVALQRRALPFDIVDAGPSIGGIWDIERERTPMYRSAHFISSKTLSGFADLPMPAEYPDYPRHDRILAYIQGYARHHGLTERVRLNTRVVEARPTGHDLGEGWAGSGEGQVSARERRAGARETRAGSGGWRVSFDDGSAADYRALVVATGLAWHPNLPDVEGEFDGQIMHSFDYREPSQLEGRRVLIVGAGNSGVDIACDAARSADFACISIRRGYRFVPKYIFGTPADVFAHKGPPLPAWLEKKVFTFLLDRLAVGDLTRFGLPRPDHDVLSSHPIMNTQILHHLGHGDLEVRPDLARFEGPEVCFTDGRREAFDLVIFATGYRRLFPFLPDEVGGGDVGGSHVEGGGGSGDGGSGDGGSGDVRGSGGGSGDGGPGDSSPLDLYLNVFHRTRSDLAFIGLFENDGPAYTLMGQQAELVARVFDPGFEDVEFASRRATAHPDLRGGRRYLATQRHDYYVNTKAYTRALELEAARLDSPSP